MSLIHFFSSSEDLKRTRNNSWNRRRGNFHSM